MDFSVQALLVEICLSDLLFVLQSQAELTLSEFVCLQDNIKGNDDKNRATWYNTPPTCSHKNKKENNSVQKQHK
jgi:hypothetical protein